MLPLAVVLKLGMFPAEGAQTQIKSSLSQFLSCRALDQR